MKNKSLLFLSAMGILTFGSYFAVHSSNTKIQKLGAIGFAATPLLAVGAIIAQGNERQDDDPRMKEVYDEFKNRAHNEDPEPDDSVFEDSEEVQFDKLKTAYKFDQPGHHFHHPSRN